MELEFPLISTSPSMKKRAAASTSKSRSRSTAAKEKTEGGESFFASSNPSRKPYDFDLPSFAAAASRDGSPDLFSRHRMTPTPSSKMHTAAAATIADLKASVASGIESLKRHLDVSHSQIVNEFDASSTRLSKRFKIQTKACVQLTEEAEKDYKKVADRMSEHAEIIKGAYSELISQAHPTSSRVCKVSIPELMQSMEKAIDVLRCRYKVPTTPV
ncbi:uncharacterized protein LOC121984941 isoform X1 [Zingiber officinale]|uniref:Uncharacterized protein n=1 Tax=Zingiber officinale TaxID=94328 RepID=A0A8J5GIG1_ZINOF|nr:uncharacterized protein LOC121984941 isoform X1 [Zingiber officinale]KAG6504022.1 hypothetical protein ZIOFF_036346 [Zingiber officinale]